MRGGTHLSGTGQSITGLSDADIQAQLADMQIAHNILCLILLDLGLLGSSLGWSLRGGLHGNNTPINQDTRD